MDFHNFVATGEILLGYPNEYGLYTERPLLDARVAGATDLPLAVDEPQKHDLGRNGSYLVFRQLHQDVRGFWRWVYEQAGEAGAVTLAEAMVGRRLETGEPFTGLGRAEIPGIDQTDGKNSFNYRGDPDGRVCPIGAHIRRANPRTGDYPQGRMGLIKKLLALLGLTGTPEQDRIASTRFHRVLRRGRAYGAPLDYREASRAGWVGAGDRAAFHLPQRQSRAAVRVHPGRLARQRQVRRHEQRAGSRCWATACPSPATSRPTASPARKRTAAAW